MPFSSAAGPHCSGHLDAPEHLRILRLAASVIRVSAQPCPPVGEPAESTCCGVRCGVRCGMCTRSPCFTEAAASLQRRSQPQPSVTLQVGTLSAGPLCHGRDARANFPPSRFGERGLRASERRGTRNYLIRHQLTGRSNAAIVIAVLKRRGKNTCNRNGLEAKGDG